MKLTSAQYRALPRRRPGYRPRKSAEHRMQVECVDWFRITYPGMLLLAIPNGARFGGDKFLASLEWARLEAEGAIAGAADLLLCQPSGDFGGLFLEMKTRKGKQSETQKEFEAQAIAAGYGYAIPKSLKQFQQVVTGYLETGKY